MRKMSEERRTMYIDFLDYVYKDLLGTSIKEREEAFIKQVKHVEKQAEQAEKQAEQAAKQAEQAAKQAEQAEKRLITVIKNLLKKGDYTIKEIADLANTSQYKVRKIKKTMLN